MGKQPNLREQKKAETREAVLVAARGLFAEKGFDRTTLDEICAQARISRRTFFRYFPTKEALVFPNRESRLQAFQHFMALQPPGQPVFDILRRAAQVFAVEYTQNREQILASQQLINTSNALLAHEREIDHEWEAALEEAFRAEEEDTPEGRRWARVVAGATIGVIRATMRYWFDEGGEEDLAELGEEALDRLQRGFERARRGEEDV